MQIHPAITNKEKYFHEKQQPGSNSKDISLCWFFRHSGLLGSSLTARTALFQFAQIFLSQRNCDDFAVLPHKFLFVPSDRDCWGELT